MSTDDIGLELVPDAESSIVVEVSDELDLLPSLVPVFEDLVSEELARQLPAVYDEQAAIQQLSEGTANPATPTAVSTPQVPIGRSWVFDFETGQFQMVGHSVRKTTPDELVTIQQWIRRCLTTERYSYWAYPDWFGVELGDVLDGTLSGQAAQSRAAQTVKDALLVHDRISAVTDVQVSETPGTISLSCQVTLDQGEQFSVTQTIG